MDAHVQYINIDQIDRNRIFDWMNSMYANLRQSMELHEEIEIPRKRFHSFNLEMMNIYM